ncbi:hypothetical protein SETIT_7G041400v2 [Setaria italica]|uniref:Protein kinase domain-containing protein n=1 Tax=Setaria italica TaxID=4555 RepID=A0A368RRP5_SETIT|nr:hypothetical protein SETIT_7G041400v2 [Setaria italica]
MDASKLLWWCRLPSLSPTSASASSPHALTTVRQCHIRPASGTVSSLGSRVSNGRKQAPLAALPFVHVPGIRLRVHLQEEADQIQKPQPLHPSLLKKRKILAFDVRNATRTICSPSSCFPEILGPEDAPPHKLLYPLPKQCHGNVMINIKEGHQVLTVYEKVIFGVGSHYARVNHRGLSIQYCIARPFEKADEARRIYSRLIRCKHPNILHPLGFWISDPKVKWGKQEMKGQIANENQKAKI